MIDFIPEIYSISNPSDSSELAREIVDILTPPTLEDPKI